MSPAALSPAQTAHSARAVLAANMIRLRRERGWSQEALAFECGLHRTFVAHCERQVRNISLDNLERIANAFGVQAYALLMPPGIWSNFARESAAVFLAQQGFYAGSALSVSPRCVFGVAALKALQHKAFSEATGVAWCVTSFLGVRGRPASQHRPLSIPCPALVDESGHSPKSALTDKPCLHVRMQLFAPGIVQAARQEKREKPTDGHPGL